VKISRRSIRSAPAYVDTGEGVVSLVCEATATEIGPMSPEGARLTVTGPRSVYVLDDTGVQRLGFGASARPFVAIGAAFLLGPLQWVLIGRRRQHGG